MKTQRALSFLPFLVALFLTTSDAFAADGNLVYVQAHAGQVDTDGILSPGEQPNPNINYNRAQREGERAGDPRVLNPSNDAAAAQDRDYGRGQFDYPRPNPGYDNRNYDNRNYDNRDNGYPGDDRYEHRRHDRDQRDSGGSWWNR